jgi:threonylcarbamoyladenosine tRNA methylthiotransferase MtaB
MQERKNIQPHLHIPLQSGCDQILTRMNRKYSTRQFADIIALCHQRLPEAAIGIDILAGFPGETDEHFTVAKNFIQALPVSYLHVFPYSIRPGTVAAGFKHHVSKKIKDERVAELRSISDSKKMAFYQKQLGQIRPVLVEGRRDSDSMLKGFTDNYIDVRFTGPDRLLNSLTPVRLLSIQDNRVIGERVDYHEN